MKTNYLTDREIVLLRDTMTVEELRHFTNVTKEKNGYVSFREIFKTMGFSHALNNNYMQDKTLKERIQEVFPDARFDRHETDLYVKVQPGLVEWLKSNYEYYNNIQRFTSQIDGTPWLDIPFAAWSEKYPTQK